MPFDIQKSTITDQAMAEWIDTEITDDLSQVPAVGPATVTAMEADGITSTWQLFGKFFSLREEGMEDVDQMNGMWQYLDDCNTPSGRRAGVVHAIAEKCRMGIRIPADAGHIVEPTPGGYDPSKSMVSESSMRAFCTSSDPELISVPGIGAKSVEALHEQGIHNTYQLFGHFLMYKEHGRSFQHQCDDFYHFLSEVKTSSGHRAGVIACLVEKLGTGISVGGGEVGFDSYGEEAEPEQEQEPLPELEPETESEAEQDEEHEQKEEQEQEELEQKSAGNSHVTQIVSLLVILAAVGAYWFLEMQ